MIRGPDGNDLSYAEVDTWCESPTNIGNCCALMNALQHFFKDSGTQARDCTDREDWYTVQRMINALTQALGETAPVMRQFVEQFVSHGLWHIEATIRRSESEGTSHSYNTLLAEATNRVTPVSIDTIEHYLTHVRTGPLVFYGLRERLWQMLRSAMTLFQNRQNHNHALLVACMLRSRFAAAHAVASPPMTRWVDRLAYTTLCERYEVNAEGGLRSDDLRTPDFAPGT